MNNMGYILRHASSGLPPVWKLTPEEPYYIRRFDPTLPRDLETVYVMDLHPSVQDMPDKYDEDGDELYYEEMLAQTDEFGTDKKAPSSIFAVTDDQSRVLGWVWYYADKHNSFPDVLAKELEVDKQALFIEVSYQKLASDWPAKVLAEIETLDPGFLQTPRKGVAVSGVRQTLEYLRATKKDKRIIVYAYTDLGNYPSEKVLERNGFKCAGELEYDEGVPNHVWYREI